jgi:hypothetical protein
VEQELLTLSEHLSSHPVLNGVRVDLKKKDKRINNDMKNTTQKTIEQHEPHLKPGVNSGALKG